MATPKKQKSGRWSVQVYLGTDKDGKRIYKRISASTKKECEYLATMVRHDGIAAKKPTVTLREAVEEYIESISNVASPSTLRGYNIILKNAFPHLMDTDIHLIDNAVMQIAVNEESKRITQYGRPLSPKTLANEYGLIEVALARMYDRKYVVKLPQKDVVIKEFPEPQLIYNAIKGTNIELPALLAMWLSLTESEIRGIDCSSIRNGVLHIEKTIVPGVDGDAVRHKGKVETRIRNHRIPTYIMRLIESTTEWQKYCEDGENRPLIPLTGTQMHHRFVRIAKAQGWKMTFHDLRAVSASIMLLLNIPDKYAMQRGGWKTDFTYKRVYQQTFDSQRDAVDSRIDEYFEEFLDQN